MSSICQPDLLCEKQVAAMWGVSAKWLQKGRQTGRGPRYHTLGSRVKYARSDLEEYLRTHARTSTSEPEDDAGEDRLV